MTRSLRRRAVRLGLLFVLAVPVAANAQSDSGATEVPRTPWGHPDLQGIWDYRTATPLERPEEMGDTVVVTGEDVASFLQIVHRDYQAFQGRVLGADWSDHLVVGLAEGGRTSLIVDPPNGRLPPLTERATEKTAEGFASYRAAHGFEDRTLQERCIMYKSAPIGWSGDSNNVLILQTPDTVVVLHEMIHEALIIQLDGRPHLPSHIRQWSGDARGRWEGDTLVVETINRHAQWRSGFDPFMDTPNMRVVERFTRVDADTLSYEFTVDDPETYTRSWSAAWPMRRTEQPLYERGGPHQLDS